MRFKPLAALLVMLAVPAAAAPSWDAEKAIAAAKALCPKDHPIASWSAELLNGKWEVLGRGANRIVDLVVSIPVDSDKPLACVITRSPPSSNLRAL